MTCFLLNRTWIKHNVNILIIKTTTLDQTVINCALNIGIAYPVYKFLLLF